MIENELSRFKMKIQTIKSKKHHYSLEYLEEDDKNILQILRDSEKMIRDFEGKRKDIKTDEAEEAIEQKDTTNFSTPDNNKNVHFTNTIKVVTYPKGKNEASERKRAQSLSTSDTDDLENEIEEEDMNFNGEDTTSSSSNDDENYNQCPNNDFFDFDIKRRDFDIQSFHSLPNLSENELGNLMRITKCQSVQDLSNEDLSDDDCSCYMDVYQNHETEINTRSTEVQIQRQFDKNNSGEMLTIRRMEIEEKNYNQLIIFNKTCNPEFDFKKPQHELLDLQEIESLAENKLQYELNVLRFYFQKWVNFVTLEKIVKTNAFNNQDRVKKINNFLTKIRIEQKKGATTKIRKNSNGAIFTKMENVKVKKDYEHK